MAERRARSAVGNRSSSFMKGNASLLERRTVAVAGSSRDCARDKRLAAAWRHAYRRGDNDGLRRCARRGSRGAVMPLDADGSLILVRRSGCGAGLRAGKKRRRCKRAGCCCSARRRRMRRFRREGVGAQPYHLCVGKKCDCRCGQKRRWREAGEGRRRGCAATSRRSTCPDGAARISRKPRAV